MISEKMKDFVKGSSVIRAMFEEGKRMAEMYGADRVYDYSLGNPSVEPPLEVKEAIVEVLEKENANYVHGYMNNSGYEDVRMALASSINEKFGTSFSGHNIVMTAGAAGGLNVIMKTLLNEGEEVIVFAPFFSEYKNYVENFNGKLVIVPPNTVDFQPDLEAFQQLISEKTKAVIINTPNNPTGVVYKESAIREMAKILNKKQEEYGTSIYLISDEPYREIVYDGIKVPYLTKHYRNTIIAYSYSKSLSLPGERIGYLVIPKQVDDYVDIISAVNVANRILGFVNAPSLMQRVIAKCCNLKIDISVYKKNRDLLYNALTEYGYECVKPEGTFYLFIRALEEDDVKFAAMAKNHNILIVPASSFGCPGYCRIAYCVDTEKVERSLPAFKNLALEYKI